MPFNIAPPPEDEGSLSQLPSQLPSQMFPTSSMRWATGTWGCVNQEAGNVFNQEMGEEHRFYQQQGHQNYQDFVHDGLVPDQQLEQDWLGSQAFSNNRDQGRGNHGLLRPVSEIPAEYQCLFSQFPYFNIVQSTVFNDILYSDRSVVVSAPTGSGKTVIMELAMLRLLIATREQHARRGDHDRSHPRIVYMAPMKALVSERYLDWQQRMGALGVTCAEVTGDTDHDDIAVIKNSQVVLTTPEKWDSLTRRWRDHASLMQAVSLLLIDEVHVLNDEERGPTLEAVVSRMKTIRATRPSDANVSLRFVAVSATIPNVADVAAWLSDGEGAAISHKLEETLRPVKLRRVVLGYERRETWSEFRFEISLNYKLPSVIATYSNNKPTLVFVSTRKSAQITATTLSQQGRFVRDSTHKQLLSAVANSLRDGKLRECVMCGVGYHHAGLEMSDRRQVEELFLAGHLPALVATSTLAMGVNLPAHLVIIKSTSQYVGGCYQEYTTAQLLQMTGRAGRPQFDNAATAVIMTKFQHKTKYENLVNGRDVLESHLHLHLVEHLNAEIVLGTVTDLGVAVEWLRSTYFYVRVQHNPRHYGLPLNLQQSQLEAKLQEMCTREVNGLARAGLIELSEVDIRPTPPGRLMARYCVSFITMKTFLQLRGDESLRELVELVSACREFRDVKVRVSEKRTLNELNKGPSSSIRFPVKGKIKSREQKINCLIQALLGSQTITDPSLNQESTKIMRTGQRLTKCLTEYVASRREYELQLNTILLAKSFACRLWENSRHVTRQLGRIGPTFSASFVQAKITSFTALEATTPRNIELILNRQPPFGNFIRDQAVRLPRYELTLEQTNQVKTEVSDLKVTIKLANHSELRDGVPTTQKNHSCRLIIGDMDNNVAFQQRITDTALMVAGSVTRELTVTRASLGDELAINFISESWAGLDVQSSYTPRYLHLTPATSMASSSSSGATTTIPFSTANVPSISGTACGGHDGRRACLHNCNDKRNCAHNCCKVGVTGRTPSGEAIHTNSNSVNNSNNNYSSISKRGVPVYVQEIRKRATQMQDPSLKKLKMTDNNGNMLSKFKFSPRGPLLLPKPTPKNSGKLFDREKQQHDQTPQPNKNFKKQVYPKGQKTFYGSQSFPTFSNKSFDENKVGVKFSKNDDMFADDFPVDTIGDFECDIDDPDPLGSFPDMEVFVNLEEKGDNYDDTFNDSLELSDIPDNFDQPSFHAPGHNIQNQQVHQSISKTSTSTASSFRNFSDKSTNSTTYPKQQEQQNQLNQQPKWFADGRSKPPTGQASLDNWLRNSQGNQVRPQTSSGLPGNHSKPHQPKFSSHNSNGSRSQYPLKLNPSQTSKSGEYHTDVHQVRPFVMPRNQIRPNMPFGTHMAQIRQQDPGNFQVPCTSFNTPVVSKASIISMQRLHESAASQGSYGVPVRPQDMQTNAFTPLELTNVQSFPNVSTRYLPDNQMSSLQMEMRRNCNESDDYNPQSNGVFPQVDINNVIDGQKTPADQISLMQQTLNQNSSQTSIRHYNKPVMGVKPITTSAVYTANSQSKSADDIFSNLAKEFKSSQRDRVQPKLNSSSVQKFPAINTGINNNNRLSNTMTGNSKGEWRDLEMFQWCRQQERHSLRSLYNDTGDGSVVTDENQQIPNEFEHCIPQSKPLSQFQHPGPTLSPHHSVPRPSSQYPYAGTMSEDIGLRPSSQNLGPWSSSQRSVPGPLSQYPGPGPLYLNSAPDPSSQYPSPGPSSQHSAPGPSFQYPGPGPSSQHSAGPGPSSQHSSDLGPSSQHLIPGPSSQYPGPGPSSQYSIPGPSSQYPGPGPSSQHSAPGPSFQYSGTGPSSSTPWPVCQYPGTEQALAQHSGPVSRTGTQNPEVEMLNPRLQITYGESRTGVGVTSMGGIQQNININLPSVLGSVPPALANITATDTTTPSGVPPVRGILKTSTDSMWQSRSDIFDGIL